MIDLFLQLHPIWQAIIATVLSVGGAICCLVIIAVLSEIVNRWMYE